MLALVFALHGGMLSVVCRTQVKKGSLQNGRTLARKRRAVLTDVCPVDCLPPGLYAPTSQTIYLAWLMRPL